MLTVKPWSKEAEKIFKQLKKNRGIFTFNPNLNREIGRHCPQLIDNNYIDVSPPSHKKNRYWINLLPDITIEEKPTTGKSKFIRFNFMKKF